MTGNAYSKHENRIATEADIFAGNQLKRIRRLSGFTQKQLAQAIGISFQQLQKYEKAINRMTVNRLQQFADALNVPLSSFFQSLNEIDPRFLRDNTESHPVLTEYEKEVLKILRNVKGSKAKEQVLEVLKILAKPDKN